MCGCLKYYTTNKNESSQEREVDFRTKRVTLRSVLIGACTTFGGIFLSPCCCIFEALPSVFDINQGISAVLSSLPPFPPRQVHINSCLDGNLSSLTRVKESVDEVTARSKGAADDAAAEGRGERPGASSSRTCEQAS